MRGEQFDRVIRGITTGEGWSASRRTLLRAMGLGGAAVAIGATAVSATPQRSKMGQRARMQDATPIAAPIDDLAFSLEYDLDQMFAYVRDQVAYDPYPGSMRGATGALWGLAGNAADQALLLAQLLSAGMVRTRLVEGELTADAAATLLAAGALSLDAAKARAESLFAPSVDSADATSPTDDASAVTPAPTASAEQFSAFMKQVTDTIDSHTSDGIAAITAALEGAGITLPSPTAVVPELERTRHVWLQYESGPDWIDLDPTMPNAKPGDAFAQNPKVLDTLPDELRHRVSFKLIAEQVAGTEVTRNELLTYEAPSSDLVGLPMTLMHPEPQALDSIGVAISGLLDGYQNFVPSLLIGEQTIFGAPVTFGTGGGVFSTLGGSASDGDTLAEWLEITVTTPSGQTTVTRTVFDRVGDEARAAGPVDPTKIPPAELVDAGDPESNFLPLAGLWSFAIVTGDIAESQVPRQLPQETSVNDILSALHTYHYARNVEALRAADLSGARVFHDAPNVTAFVLQPTAVGTDDQTAGVGLDLIHRSLALAPGSASSGAHPLLAAGVLAHAVELTMFESGTMAPLNLPVSATSAVLKVFAAANAAGIATQVLQPGNGATAPATLAPGPQELVQAALDAGLIVIIPEKAVQLGGRDRIGWWLVDPATGQTRDQMDDGRGSTMTEYATLLIKVAACIVMFAALGTALGSVMRGVALVIRGGSDGGILGAGAGAVLGGTAGMASAGACAA